MYSEQSHKFHGQLFKYATESVVVTNSKGLIVTVNPAALKLFGYTENEIIGQKIEKLMATRFEAVHQTHRAGFNKNPHNRSMGIGLDLHAMRKDGSEFPVEISLSPFTLNDESYVMAFIIDITARKKVQAQMLEQKNQLEDITRMLKQSNERLEAKVLDRTKVLEEALNEIEKSRKELSEALAKEKELNELKSRFLSMASHEFRTPLTTILSSASLITAYAEKEQQDKRIRHVERIKSAVNNLNDILSDFLSLSKIEEGKTKTDYEVFNLNNVISEIINDLATIKKPGQAINYVHTGKNDVLLDPRLIRNIVINILSNAIKFSDEGKLIEIKTDIGENTTVLEFKDQGIGISKEDQQHLFERFFRGSNATNIQGTGLGLNIVARYVELMNGVIETESELNKGTSFKITIPC